MIRIVKILRQLHLNKYFYNILSPFFHSHIAYTKESIEQSISYLENFSANKGSSAICNNFIDDIPFYDLQIIIPAYNVEDFIEQCIDSILHQKTTFKYLICIINDGSTDNTREILKKYESLENVQITDQKNRGFSGARNTGLAHIKAKYIMFVDSDDYLESTNSIQKILNCAFREDADIVEGGYRLFFKDITLNKFIHNNTIGKSVSLYGFPWGKVYKANLWQNIHFPENYWFEDTVNSFLIFPKAHIKVNISDIIYSYRKNPKGISVSSHKKNRNIDSLWITKQLLEDNRKIQALNEEQALACFLGQISVNQRRIETIERNDINKAVFVINKAILEDYFPNYNINKNNKRDQVILTSLIENDYSAFRLAALLL